MYSETVERILALKGIKPGDTVELKRGSEKFEGVLMQRTEAGDNNIVVLKLKNGYNIGVMFTQRTQIEKIKAHVASQAKRSGLKFKTNLNKVELIYTGGTIGSKVDYVTGGVHMLTTPDELLQKVPELADIADFRINNLMSLASEDMSYMEWQMIAKAVAEAFNKGVRGVLITHGTDTMHYTAAALSFMLKDIGGPVILTGAQRSPDRGSSDAFMNLVCSSHLAAKSDIAEVGICMHASSSDDFCNFMRGTRTRKMHTSKRDAFQPIDNRPIARLNYNGSIEYISDYRRINSEAREAKAVTGFEPKVALVKIYPNSDPDILNYYLGKGYKGVVIEGTGLGHAPVSTFHKEYNWLGSIKRAVDSGMIIGITSQCISGRVSDRVYRNLRLMKNAGAVYCEDMMPEVAYVKLGFLLGNYKKAQAESLLGENMVGEINLRSEVDWFGE